MSAVRIPDVVVARLHGLASEQDALQHPDFAPALLTFHQPPSRERDACGSWSIQGFTYEFRLVGQLSAHHTFMGPYGDMLYHKQKERYAGPWCMQDVSRAKRKFSIVLPDVSAPSEPVDILHRQYKHLDDIQRLNFDKTTQGLAVRARLKSSFAMRSADEWRVSAVSENIFSTQRPSFNGGDCVNLQPKHDPDGIVSRIKQQSEVLVNELQAVNNAGASVPLDLLCVTFRPGSWIELSCKLRVWSSSSHGEQARSYQVVTDGVQLLAAGTLQEDIVTSAPISPPKKKRKFEPVLDPAAKRPRLGSSGAEDPVGLESGLHGMRLGNP